MTDYWNKEIVVLGCGNVLFGDDGFGPVVVEYLEENYELPPEVGVINAGSGVRKLLFTFILSEKRSRKIVIVDAMDVGSLPGEVSELDIDEIPKKKTDDFSMHQLPTSNLLRELKESCGVDVKIISVQTQNIPEEVSPGLSRVIRDSIPAACEKILHVIND